MRIFANSTGTVLRSFSYRPSGNSKSFDRSGHNTPYRLKAASGKISYNIFNKWFENFNLYLSPNS